MLTSRNKVHEQITPKSDFKINNMEMEHWLMHSFMKGKTNIIPLSLHLLLWQEGPILNISLTFWDVVCERKNTNTRND